MTTERRPTALELAWSRARLATRYATAIVLATIAGGVVWLVMETVFEEAGFERVEFARELALGLGVEGDRQTVGVAGLAATMLGFFLIVLIQGAVVEPMLRRAGGGAEPSHLARYGPAFALTLLASGLIAAPVMGIGAFGLSDGAQTFLALVVSAAAASIALVRVYTLVITRRWWEEKSEGVEHAFAERPAGSLELPEERGEEGGEGAGRRGVP